MAAEVIWIRDGLAGCEFERPFSIAIKPHRCNRSCSRARAYTVAAPPIYFGYRLTRQARDAFSRPCNDSAFRADSASGAVRRRRIAWDHPQFTQTR